MSEYEPPQLWKTYTHRLLAEGVHYRDILDMRERISTFADWCVVWSDWAKAAEQRGDEALKSGFTNTAALEFSRSSIYYFFAQMILWHDPAKKRTAYDNCARTFERAAPHLDPPLQRVEIPYRNITLPAYLRLPKGVKKPPLVILMGGLDTTKEEQLVISSLCVQRGLATLAFDGPGQGQAFYKIKMSAKYDEALRAVFDFAEKIEGVDRNRLGMIGRSLGGHFGPRAAGLDRRIKAAVAWGAMYHLRNYKKLPQITTDGFIYVTGSKSIDEVVPYFESINLDGIASQITCPLMIVHGGLDPITPTENAMMLKDAAKGPVQLLFWQDSVHCVHDRAHICRPAMADFMQKNLSS